MSPTDDAHLTADEDIIELTDIIEKGNAPQAQSGSDAASFEKELEDLFSDGGGLESLTGFDTLDADIAPPPPAPSPAVPMTPDDDGSHGDAGPGYEMDASMDADIDALLNSIGDLPDTPDPAPAQAPAAPKATAAHHDAEEAPSMAAKHVSSTPSAITGRPVDPDEKLSMPDMTDVDALLGDLGAPSAADLTSGGSGSSLGDDDIDDLISGLDAKAPPAAAPAPQKPADLVDVADLDALLEDMLGSGGKAAAPAPEPEPEPAPEAPAQSPLPDETDPFEAALAASAAQPSVAPPDEPPADGDPFEAALAAAATAAAMAEPEPPRPAPKAAPAQPADDLPEISPEIPADAPLPDVPGEAEVGDSPAGYAARIEALEASLASLAEQRAEESAAREALETRLTAMESLADAAPALSEDTLAELLEPLLAREDGPFAPLVDRVRAALSEDLDARIEERLAPLRERLEGTGATSDAGAEGITHADLDMLAADLRATLQAETDKAAAAAAARIIREEIAALAEAL
ncbi:hypothetical protein [Nitratidesulfovibrio sp. SRB-5]|uniref:hypothetical protein n=1 Tax=Nitratidesulfovibrio sp. SRB-5 TaxID=2872636 RepID=UPI001CBE72D6|nr:hypothetical protein [Nitratidesulfovibrio sp. SRB-5]MBZ2170670.1 hypothetical protein [Nitratidesulfovibrio sp. SRB-5]